MNKISPKYQAYLSSKNWKNKRKEILEKKGNFCSFCFTNKKIQIHHSRYRDPSGKSILNREKHGILFPLCATCHRKWHIYFGHNLVLNQPKIDRANMLYLNGISLDDSIRFCFSGPLGRVILKAWMSTRGTIGQNRIKRLKKPIMYPNPNKPNNWDKKWVVT